MLTCSKLYTDIPFAHRQHRHAGHCSLVHGHNWSFEFTFGCEETDSNGFVVDFGGLKFIKAWIDDHLDHACVFNEDDPDRETLVSALPSAWKVFVVPNCSSEGLAQFLFHHFDSRVRESTAGRAFILEVTVIEDSKNRASYTKTDS